MFDASTAVLFAAALGMARPRMLRRSSFDVAHRLLRADGVLGVEGFETRVWVARHPEDPERIRGVPVPEEVVAAFARP